MEKTVCELFAGVGGFRCGLNNIKTLSDLNNEEKWKTVWFSQWEPSDKRIQYAHDCYVYHFGTCLDSEGNDTTNVNIEEVNKSLIPDFNLLVGGFPCQDYSIASTLKTSKGLEGKKGVLWWSIREILEIKKPSFVLLENVDRLLKSPASQRGRDMGVILACFRDEGYNVEWRVINAADYGFQQRRRRVFIFAYKSTTNYSKRNDLDIKDIIYNSGFFATTFKVKNDYFSNTQLKKIEIPTDIGEVSNSFEFSFENSGLMKDGIVYTIKTIPDYNGPQITLSDIMENDLVSEKYFIPKERLYYTNEESNHSDETVTPLSYEEKHTWQYIKGAKRILRKASNGHEYVYSEGPVPLIDEWNKPARTMLTSEGNFSRTTHLVKDKITQNIRLITPTEAERIQGFPTDHTKYCLVNNEIINMPENKRMFMMGNALVVNLITEMEKTLSTIFESE